MGVDSHTDCKEDNDMDDLEIELTPKQENYQNLAETIINKFNTRGIEGYYCIGKAFSDSGQHYIMGRFDDSLGDWSYR